MELICSSMLTVPVGCVDSLYINLVHRIHKSMDLFAFTQNCFVLQKLQLKLTCSMLTISEYSDVECNPKPKIVISHEIINNN